MSMTDTHSLCCLSRVLSPPPVKKLGLILLEGQKRLIVVLGTPLGKRGLRRRDRLPLASSHLAAGRTGEESLRRDLAERVLGHVREDACHVLDRRRGSLDGDQAV